MKKALFALCIIFLVTSIHRAQILNHIPSLAARFARKERHVVIVVFQKVIHVTKPKDVPVMGETSIVCNVSINIFVMEALLGTWHCLFFSPPRL